MSPVIVAHYGIAVLAKILHKRDIPFLVLAHSVCNLDYTFRGLRGLTVNER